MVVTKEPLKEFIDSVLGASTDVRKKFQVAEKFAQSLATGNLANIEKAFGTVPVVDSWKLAFGSIFNINLDSLSHGLGLTRKQWDEFLANLTNLDTVMGCWVVIVGSEEEDAREYEAAQRLTHVLWKRLSALKSRDAKNPKAANPHAIRALRSLTRRYGKDFVIEQVGVPAVILACEDIR